PPAKMRLRLAHIAPVIARHVHRNRERARHVDEDRAIGTAVPEQEHLEAPVLAQARGRPAAGGAGADDHIVEAFTVLLHIVSPSSAPPKGWSCHLTMWIERMLVMA